MSWFATITDYVSTAIVAVAFAAIVVMLLFAFAFALGWLIISFGVAIVAIGILAAIFFILGILTQRR